MSTQIILETKTAELYFDNSPLNVQRIFFKPERTKVCADCKQQFILRMPDAVSDPVLLDNIVAYKYENNSINFTVTDNKGLYTVEVNIEGTDNGFKFRASVSSPSPAWMLEWKLTGLQFNSVVIPALGGQSVNSEMPDGTTLSYKYPFWWNAQFMIGEMSNCCFLLDGRDPKPDLKLLRIGKEKNKFTVTYGIEAVAPLKSNVLEGEWFVQLVDGDWKKSADIHREWLEKSFNVYNCIEHPHLPQWAVNINFILEIWGARKALNPSHTFRQMIQRIEEFAKLHRPGNTLLYLPGFAENGIDSQAPDYNPSSQCGGADEFRLLVDTAHELGYKVMVHTNVLALTYTHKIYNEFKKFQVIDVFNRPQGWAMDMDGDWLTEPYFAYVNPGYTEWGDYMSGVIGELIEKYSVDGVFLDQTLLAFNVSQGPNFIKGMREHIRRLQNDYPDILFAGEGLHEQNVEVLPMAQIHGLDSIAEVHGMEGQVAWRNIHPVSRYLFGKYTIYTAHLLTKHPSHPMFKLQEKYYSELDVIPALCLYDSSQEIHLPEVHGMISRVKNRG